MRHVMDNDMVAHVWAAQSQDDARNAQKNFYFEGDTIYSYGRHFPIARFVKNDRRERAVLFTTRGYSNTTSKHIHTVRGALRGLNVATFHIERPGDSARSSDIKRDYEQRIDDFMEQAARARLRSEYLMDHAQALATEANQCAEFFGWDWRLPIPELSEEKIKAARKAVREANARRRKENEERAERYRKEAEERAARDAVTREEWLRGEDVRYPQYGWGDVQEDTLLRVHGDMVQTSRGAEIPVCHAKRLWPIILKHRIEGTFYQRNGHSHHVGQFVVERIEANGDIKVGCHFIKFDQILKIAVELKLIAAEHVDAA
jgi:hypothetical protein